MAKRRKVKSGATENPQAKLQSGKLSQKPVHGRFVS